MNILVPLTMFGWIPVVAAMFWILPPRRAVLFAFLIAWLFLPMAGYKLPMIPAYTKMTAATLGTLLGVFLTDVQRLMAFRPRWIDLPIVIWCVGKFGASLTNGYGAYDAFSSVEYALLTWGLPWLFGRLYFSSAAGMRELAVGIVIGGLVYVPLCLIEVKTGPELQAWVYGIQRLDWLEAKRFGGWRPTVFMQHGLMVGMWMCMSGLTAWWLWLTGAVKSIGRFPMSWAATAIFITAICCKSFGAISLLLLGMTVLWTSWKFRRGVLLWILLASIPSYMGLRLSATWSGDNLVNLSESVGGSDRAKSLQSRLHSEDQFIRVGWERPWFGFRGWYNTLDEQDKDTKLGVPDAMWMIEFTAAGLFGLVGLFLYFVIPPFRVWKQLVSADWRNPYIMTAVGLSVVVVLSMFDNLFNAMLNPVFMLAAGALSGWVAESSRVKAVVNARRPVSAKGAAGVTKRVASINPPGINV